MREIRVERLIYRTNKSIPKGEVIRFFQELDSKGFLRYTGNYLVFDCGYEASFIGRIALGNVGRNQDSFIEDCCRCSDYNYDFWQLYRTNPHFVEATYELLHLLYGPESRLFCHRIWPKDITHYKNHEFLNLLYYKIYGKQLRSPQMFTRIIKNTKINDPSHKDNTIYNKIADLIELDRTCKILSHLPSEMQNNGKLISRHQIDLLHLTRHNPPHISVLKEADTETNKASIIRDIADVEKHGCSSLSEIKYDCLFGYKEWKKHGDFPEPPLNETEKLKPIDSLRKMSEIGREFHNCIGDDHQLREVYEDNKYYYVWRDKEPVVICLAWNTLNNGHRSLYIDQMLGKYNCDVSDKTRNLINQTLKSKGVDIDYHNDINYFLNLEI